MPQHYRLVDGTLEIDGIRMHQTARKTPLQDAFDKVAALRPKRGMKALDICTGLGYTAIELARKGCSVLTIEKDPIVLEVVKNNSASKELFGNKLIEIRIGNAYAILPALSNEYFDIICHDPPRLSMAGELYSEAFYRELHRVMKKGGRLFHYTGTPGAKRGKNIPRGVKERLQRVGFSSVEWKEDLQGFLAKKKLRFLFCC